MGNCVFYPEDEKDDDPANGGAAAEVYGVFIDASLADPSAPLNPKAFDLLERHHNMGKKSSCQRSYQDTALSRPDGEILHG
jgi:hypothetical protein